MEQNEDSGVFTEFAYLDNRSNKKANLVSCSFSNLSDQELLNTPATTIARERRLLSTGGREVVVGDICDTFTAVRRIPDIDAEVTDYRPGLDFSSWNEAPKPLEGRYRINRRIASRGIAPRVAEPSLPPQTKTTTLESTTDGLSLSAVENAILKATQAVQLTKRVGGQHQELAELYGRLWGSEGLMSSDAPVDVLGDVSLPRVMARTGKRRFEVYRNIGFTSIVTAGGTQADNRAYGISSVINWQRRTEIAKLFVHFAQALEGAELTPALSFDITARIPAYTVPHLVWSDLAMRFNPKAYKNVMNQGVYTAAAETFERNGILTALVRVSDHVRALGFSVDDVLSGEPFALKFDRLTYLEPIHFPHKVALHQPELAFAIPVTSGGAVPAVSKAHDLRAATVEALVGREATAMLPLHTLRSLEAIRRTSAEYRVKSSWDWVVDVLKDLPLLVAVAAQVCQRPETYEGRHRKAEWQRIYDQQMPVAIRMTAEAYSAVGVAAAVVYTLMYDKTAQVTRTVKFHSAKVDETVSQGIRRKRHLLARGDASLSVAINQEILSGNRAFYRERYRRAARVWQLLAKHVSDREAALKCELESAWWFARSDLAHSLALNIESSPPTPIIPERKIKSVIALYLWSIKDIVGDRRRKISEMTVSAAFEWAITVASQTHEELRLRDYPRMLESTLERLLEAQVDDYAPIVDTPPAATQQHDDAPVIFTGEITMPVFAGKSVDYMVSYLVATSGQGVYLEDDDVEDFTKWLGDHLADHVTDVGTYLEVHSSGLDARQASAILDEWWELWEGAQEESGDPGYAGFDIS